jgi:circadian clock protein KaiC
MDENDRSVSSLMDTWISLKDLEANGERNRVLYLLKSRGMNHSNQLREYRITSHGIDLIDVYVGSGQVLTGTARLAQEARERDANLARQQDIDYRRRIAARKRAIIERQIADLRSQLESEESEITALLQQDEAYQSLLGANRSEMAGQRGAPHDR